MEETREPRTKPSHSPKRERGECRTLHSEECPKDSVKYVNRRCSLHVKLTAHPSFFAAVFSLEGRMRFGMSFLVLGLVSLAPAWAQVTGRLTGSVVDTSGAPIP